MNINILISFNESGSFKVKKIFVVDGCFFPKCVNVKATIAVYKKQGLI